MYCENPNIRHHLPHMLDRGEAEKSTYQIGKNECLKYVIIPEKDGVYERTFILSEGAVFRGGAIILGTNMVLKMTVLIEGSWSDASLSLLGLATTGSNIEISGIGKVTSGSQGVKLRVDQTNILLGEGAKVRGMPVLEVSTDSIEGGHSCKIHRISGESLFYLESHGLSRDASEKMLLEGHIQHHLDIISHNGNEIQEDFFSRLFKKFAGKSD